MEFCETVYTILNTICCTLLQKYKTEDIDENTHKDMNFNNQKYFDTTDTDTTGTDTTGADTTVFKLKIKPLQETKNAPVKPLCTCNHACVQELTSELLKRFTKQCEEQQQNSEKEDKWQIIIFTNKHCCGYLCDLNKPHKIDTQNSIKVTSKPAESTTLPQPQLLVTCSTRNSQCNCSAGNSTTATSYIPCPDQIQDKINENRTCLLTSTKIDSKCNLINTKSKQSSFVKLRKNIAAIFRHCHKTSNK